MRFNVKDFAPSEISVKAEGKKVLVTAKHEEQKESGKIPRNIVDDNSTETCVHEQRSVPFILLK